MKNGLRWFFLLLLFISFYGQMAAQTTNACAGLRLTSASYNQVGDLVTVYVQAVGADSLLGMQYTHSWDPTQLEFVSLVVENPVVGFTAANFNTTSLLSEGKIPVSWTEPNLQGYSPGPNDNLYGLRFRVLSSAQPARVSITNAPTVVEIVRAASDYTLESYWLQDAIIAPSGYATASITGACIQGKRCNNAQTGSIYDLSLADTSSYQFQWTGPEGFASNQADLSGLQAGSYMLTLTGSGGQTAYARMLVAADPGWRIAFTATNSACGLGNSGSINTQITGGSGQYTYLWSNGAQTPGIDNLAAGSYTVTVTDEISGCTLNKTTEIEEESLITLSADPSHPSCEGVNDGHIFVSASAPPEYGALSYAWSNGATNDSLTQLAAGVYVLTVTASNGCSILKTYVLQTGNGFTISASITQAYCQSSQGAISLNLPSPASDYTFVWSNGATTPNIQNLTPGTYSVTVTLANGGCTTEATFTVTNVEMQVGTNYTCESPTSGQLAALVWTNTAPPYTFAWSTGQITTANQFSSIAVPGTGTYSLTVTGSDGCSSVLNNIVVDCGGSTPEDLELSLSPSFSEVNNGETICLELTASNFTQINGLQFSLNWNPQLLSFTGINQLDLPGLNASNFNTEPGVVAGGRASMVWIAPNIVTGVTLPDGEALFRICFTVIGSGGVVNIDVAEVPTPVQAVNILDQFLNIVFNPAVVSINGNGSSDEVHFYADQVSTTLGQPVCVPIRANGISGVGGMQFSLRWNPENLQYAGITTATLPNVNTQLNFGTVNESIESGALRFLWADASVTNFPGLNLPNGSNLFNVCFQPLTTGTHSISFGQVPIPPVVGNVEAVSIPVTTTAGSVTVSGQNQSDVQIRIQSAAVEPGQQVCVDVVAEAFDDIISFQFAINWDDNLILLEQLIPGLQLTGFNSSNYATGANYASFSYLTPGTTPISLPAGSVLFSLCFEASATQTGLSPIFVSTVPTPPEFINGDLEEASVLFNSGQIAVTTEELVWPGDTDNNGTANHFDLLPIGLAQGLTGIARQQTSTHWAAQYSPLWQQTTPLTGIDYRHADANGDGSINLADTLALQLNWGQETNFWQGAEEEFRPTTTGAPLYVQTDTVDGGQSVAFPIILGDELNPAQAYGLAFSIVYDPAAISPGSVYITALNSWLGSLGQDLVLMYRDFVADHRIDVAFTRTDGTNLTGHGGIGELNITLEDVIFQRGTYEMPIRIENVRLINASEEPQDVVGRETTAVLENVTATTDADALPELRVSPVPTTDWVHISHPDATIEHVQLWGTNGQQLASYTKTERINLSAYPAGMYWLRIITNRGLALRKVVRQ